MTAACDAHTAMRQAVHQFAGPAGPNSRSTAPAVIAAAQGRVPVDPAGLLLTLRCLRDAAAPTPLHDRGAELQRLFDDATRLQQQVRRDAQALARELLTEPDSDLLIDGACFDDAVARLQNVAACLGLNVPSEFVGERLALVQGLAHRLGFTSVADMRAAAVPVEERLPLLREILSLEAELTGEGGAA